MTKVGVAEPVPGMRAAGGMLVLTGLAACVLFALHPNDAGSDFAAVLRNEMATRAISAVVHGGFVLLLAAQFVCFTVLSRRLDLARPSSTAGLALFAIGALFFSGALVLDGVVGPALAARYLPKPEKVEFARASFVLLGTIVGTLQLIGLGFQSAAIVAWGWALGADGRRAIGALTILFGFALLAGVAAAVVVGGAIPLIGVILGTIVWAILAGVGMMRHG